MKENFIYILITEKTKRVKIGVTNDIEKRVSTLQTGNPEKIKIYYIYERDDAYQVENMLHKYFSNYKTSTNGEWFEGVSALEIRKKMLEFFI